ncbi:MAG: hypothetical protein ACLFV2_11310 [Desulfurivibrionaceae bacterium]
MAEANPTTPTREQVIYGNILDVLMKIGMLLLFVGFALYVSGILEPAVPVKDLDKYYSMPSHEYLEAITANYDTIKQTPDQWDWLSLAGHGDYLNLVVIAFLAGVTILCYLAIIPALIRDRDKLYTSFAILEVLILILAASGVISGGH